MNRKINLLLIYPYYHPPGSKNLSGVKSNFFATLLKEIDRQKFNIYIGLPAPTPFDADFTDKGAIPLYYGYQHHLIFSRYMSLWRKIFYPLMFLSCLLKTARFIRKYDIDLVHSHVSLFLAPAMAAKMLRVPCIIHIHEYGHAVPAWLNYLWLKTIPHFADGVISVARFISDAFVRKGANPWKIHTVYPGIDPDVFSRRDQSSSFKNDFKIPESHKVIGFVGRIDPEKGVEYFIEAAAEVVRNNREVSFVIIGDADAEHQKIYKRLLLDLCSQRGLNGRVIFCGYVPNLADALRAIDALVFTSPFDICPAVILEAMATGVVVINASDGGPREIVTHGETGFQVPPRDAAQIARTVREILGDESAACRLGKAANRRIVEYFDSAKNIGQVCKIYENIVSSKGG